MCADSVCIEWLSDNENKERCYKGGYRIHEPTRYFGELENGRGLIYLVVIIIIIGQ
jgi:hypothetical protein